jgi:hypothetical protein
MDELIWRKASASASNGDCVEVGTTTTGHTAGIRDSKSPERGHLTVTPVVFGELLSAIRRGGLVLP